MLLFDFSFFFSSGLDETCLSDDLLKNESKINKELSYDETLLHLLKSSLAGVPPPPQLTCPQQKIEEIINLYKDTESWMNYEGERTGILSFQITSM